MRLNFNEQQVKQASEGRYLPFEGEFPVRVTAINVTNTNAGNQKMEIVLEGLNEWAKKTGKEYIGLDDNAVSVGKRVKFIKALGIDPLTNPDTEEFIGRTAKLIRKEPTKVTSNGKEYTNWKTNWYPLDASELPAGEHVPNFESDVDMSEPAPF